MAQDPRIASDRSNTWIHRLSVLTAGATFVLVVAGGLVTSTGSGLAVPDWPTTFGHNMFLYPWSNMVGGIMIEHGHRLIGAGVGLLTLALAVWLWITDPRGWLRWLGIIALGAVIAQGILGGLRVVLVDRTLAIVHAALAQAFFALTVSVAFFTSDEGREDPPQELLPNAVPLGHLALLSMGCIYLQSMIGAVLRHTGSGLGVHLIFALVVAAVIMVLTGRILSNHRDQPRLVRLGALLGGLLIVQLLLGLGSTWGRFVTPGAGMPADVLVTLTTMHVAAGALMLATCLVLTIRVYRLLPSRVPAVGRTPRAHPTGGSGRAHARGRISDFVALTRPRVVVMVLVTTLVGFYVGSMGTADTLRLMSTLIGMGLAAGGTLALNQFLEQDVDARMDRTRLRPLPDGRLEPKAALLFGAVITGGGLLFLALAVNLLSAGVTAVSVGSYLFLYTPLKRRTSLCSVVGAVPGALPPVVGWAAARGELGVEAWVLFAILFLWQIPHSLAIARLYRDDYARAGIRLLPVIEPDGGSTGRQIVTNCLALLAVGSLPTLIGLAGSIYFIGAFVLGVGFLGFGIGLAISRSETAARRLLLASLVYLPAQLGLMAWDKLPF
jgi:protoheme IX farnesyltransferase